MSWGDLSEAEWLVLKDPLSNGGAESQGRRRSPEEKRPIINVLLWRLRCGSLWVDVPPNYGNWNTNYRRFRRLSEIGVREALSVKSGQRPFQHRQHHRLLPSFGSGRKG